VTALRIAAVFWELLLAGVARADTASALDRLCHRPDLATVIDAAAKRHHVAPLRLSLVMWSEGRRCREDAVNASTGAAGLFGILPTGSANLRHLSQADLVDPETSADLGAAHLARLLRICGAFAGALHLYHSRDGKCRNWRTDDHVRKILDAERALRRWLARQAVKVS
jgi:hypothetical protein